MLTPNLYNVKDYKDKWLKKIQADIDLKKQNEMQDVSSSFINQKIKNLKEEKIFLDNLKTKEDQFSKRIEIGKINIFNNKIDNIHFSSERKKVHKII